MTTRPQFLYRVFGLTISSDVVLPELDSVPDGSVDVRVSCAPETDESIPEVLGESLPSGANRSYQFALDGVEYFSVTGGKAILLGHRLGVNPSDSDLSDLARLYLLGSGLAAVLHQRRSVPLHLSAVRYAGKLWAFGGLSGAGKSTSAAWLCHHGGCEMFSDDVIAAAARGGKIEFSSGPPRLKLWKDALDELQLPRNDFKRLLVGKEKYQIRSGQASTTDVQLGGIFMLRFCEDEDGPLLTRLRGRDALSAIIGSIYRPEMVALLNDPANAFQVCGEIARATPVYAFSRPRNLRALDLAMRKVLDHFGSSEAISESAAVAVPDNYRTGKEELAA